MNQADIANPAFLKELAAAAEGMATGNLNHADVRCYWDIHYRALELLKNAAPQVGSASSEDIPAAIASGALSYIGSTPNGRVNCQWVADDDGVYHTGCVNAFTFIDAGPKENHMKFCCYCGGNLVESILRGKHHEQTTPRVLGL